MSQQISLFSCLQQQNKVLKRNPKHITFIKNMFIFNASTMYIVYLYHIILQKYLITEQTHVIT